MSLSFSKSNIVWLIFFILLIPFISASVSVENVDLNASDDPYNTTKADLTGYVQNVTKNTSLVYDWKENGTSIAKLNMPFNKKLSTTDSNAVRDYSSFEYNGTLGGGNSAKVPTWYDGLSTFSNDFSEYTAGQFPQNWTGRDAYHLNTKVINDSSYKGGKAYEVQSTSTGHRVVSWDEPGNLSDVRIYSQAKIGSDYVPYYVAGRGIANDSYYRLQVRNTNLLEIVVMDNGLQWPPVAATSFDYNSGDRVNLLFEVKNQTLRGKAWHEGTDEPDNWMVSTTEENINKSGWTGVGRLHTGTTYVDTFKVTNISDEDRTCVKGGCYDFDGQNDWIDIGDSVINPWEGFSISAWYKFDTLPSASDDHIIIGKGGHEQLEIMMIN